MPRGRTNQVMVRRIAAAGPDDGGVRVGRAPDRVIVEEPLEVRLDDHLVATTMRTPGHDYELAAGLVFTDGLLEGAPVQRVRYCGANSAVESGFNVVTVETGGRAPVPAPRLGTTTSSCGLCGSAALADLGCRLAPLPGTVPLDPAVLAALPDAVRSRQELFGATGSVHAAAAFDAASGELFAVREDIGRHNAVDKVVGRMLLDRRLPAAGQGLFVSGRASFEILQKAWAAGFGLVAAVSGPSSLAVEAAGAANIALVGFLRGRSMNLYSPGSG